MLPRWLWIVLLIAVSAAPYYVWVQPYYHDGGPLEKSLVVCGMVLAGWLWGALGAYTKVVKP